MIKQLLLILLLATTLFGASPQLPTVTLNPLNSSPITLAPQKAKATLVVYWATWCPPCLQEIPHLVSLLKKYGDKGLRVVAISLDDNPATVEKFISDTNLPYPVVMNTSAISDYLPRVISIPTSFLLDENLNRVDTMLGYHSESYLVKKVAPLLGVAIEKPSKAQSLLDWIGTKF